MTEAELAATLVEVRRAARLVVAWQQRVNEVFFRVHRTLEDQGLHLQWWGPNRYKALESASRPQFAPHKWAWDLFPGLTLAADWATPAAPVRRVYLALDTDTALIGAQDGGQEPDPTTFAPVDGPDARTELWLGLYTADHADPPWGPIRTATLAERWRDALDRDIPWTHDRWSGTYQCRWLPAQKLTDADAVDRLLLGPLVEWVRDHAPGAPR